MRIRIVIGLFIIAAVLTGCNLPENLGLTVAPEATSSMASQQKSGSETAFVMQASSPSYLPAFTQPDAGCNWVGVAGQVLDSQSLPVNDVTVVVKGKFNGKEVNQTGASGANKAYGPGGFEIHIGDQSEDTQGDLAIQLFDAQSHPLSVAYPVATFRNCQKNLIVFTFLKRKITENNNNNSIYVPFVNR